jgi:hypothetical protein
MFLSPEVAILQHSTGVMQISWDYFENGITFFTNLIYTAIRFAVGSGETAPFVGHNAFLRWKGKSPLLLSASSFSDVLCGSYPIHRQLGGRIYCLLVGESRI